MENVNTAPSATSPIKVQELARGRMPPHERWAGAGRMDLMSSRLAAIRLSRHIPPALNAQVVARCLGAVEKGFVLAGTFISPCERLLWLEIVRRGVPVVKMSPDPLAGSYFPKGDEGRLFAENRLLVLSHDVGTPPDRYTAWHDAGLALADLASQNGVALYVRPDSRTGHLQWAFRP